MRHEAFLPQKSLKMRLPLLSSSLWQTHETGKSASRLNLAMARLQNPFFVDHS
jgi:hypothetical protein